jgi:lycopene beta-cyclase
MVIEPVQAAGGVGVGERAFDIVMVGGGLANSLIALRLRAMRPELRLCLLEQEDGPSGSHTWSLFRSDVPARIWAWLAPLTAHRWPGYEIKFPAGDRTLANEYASVTSDSLRQAVSQSLGDEMRWGVRVVEISPHRVVAETGDVFTADLVIDGRGARKSEALALAWQKFFGIELRLDAPHGLERPVVMDATIPQLDGFRFMYLLPLSADVLLAEDTRYSAGRDLDMEALEAEIVAYVRGKGWSIAQILRRESGVLPVVLGGDINDYWREAGDAVPQSGLRAALFHPTTGYSLPDAARLAELIAKADELTSEAIAPLVRRRSRRMWRRRGFFRLLNRLMFLAAEPNQRYRVLQRFYQLSAGLIQRFYAAELTPFDRIRLLVGKPPVPFWRAVGVVPERTAYPRRVHDPS